MTTWEGLRLLILDVDGVLTDGRIRAGGSGGGTGPFHVHDGCAVKVWQRLGGEVAVLSGRTSAEVETRARELEITTVRQGVVDKDAAYLSLVVAAGLKDDQVAYMGDDLPDLGPMSRCGFSAAPASAVSAIRRTAHYVTQRAGGMGAVAEVVELILRKQRRWPAAGRIG